MTSSVRLSSWARFRHNCFYFFAALLLFQFIVWSYINVSKQTQPSSLGRRDLTPRYAVFVDDDSAVHNDAAEVDTVTQEQDSHTLLADTDRIPLRRERIADGSAQQTSVPGVDDVFIRLQEYLAMLTQEHFSTDLDSVKQLQKRSTAAELDAEPVDDLTGFQSLPTRITFLNSLSVKADKKAKVRISMFTTSSVNLGGVRSELLPWMQYHTHLGVTHFYILYDGADMHAVHALNKIRHVTLIHIHPPFATEQEQQVYRIWNQGHKQWGGKPGNYELMVKQGFGTATALRLAKERGDDWLIHMDPDELFYPDNVAFSMVEEFLRQPDEVSSIRFMNFEGQPEFGDVTNRYEQVTLFRTHKYFITPEANYLRNRCKLGDNRTFLVLYANGKSAVRVDAPGVRQLGPHFFTGDTSERWKTADNPEGHPIALTPTRMQNSVGLWRNAISNSSFILHYGYSYLSDVTSKAERSCSGDNFKKAAETVDREELGKCFLIDFDRDAYIAAITGEDEDFFYSRQVLSEGVRLKCRSAGRPGWCTVHDVDYFKYLLTKAGLFRRAREPQQILRMHEELIQVLSVEDLDLEEVNEMHPLEQGWEFS